MDANKDFKKIKEAVVAIAKANSVDYKVSTELKNSKELVEFEFKIWVKGIYFYIWWDASYYPETIRVVTSFMATSIPVNANSAIAMLWHFHEN